jgi:chitinase
VITTYNVTRLDLDTEDNSLTNSAGIDRRNKAIKMVEDWATGQGRTVQFVYTLPTTTSGLADSGLAVLRNAVANNARVDVVNIMTFDYYDNVPHEMATDTRNAAGGLHGQLQSLFPGVSSAALWARIGVTEMVGIDDFGAPETFTTSDAPTVESWAASTGIAELSFWALQRDNGGCPGTAGSDSCSGVAQSTWQFSRAFEPFTAGAGPSPSPSPSRSPSPSPSSPPPGSCTAPPWSATAVYTGGSTVSYQGHTWRAQWWTQGETPGTADVWLDDGACGSQPPPSPGSCTQPAWQANRAYTGGSVVSYQGHKWTAKWWTQGDTPGNNAQNVWADNGRC